MGYICALTMDQLIDAIREERCLYYFGKSFSGTSTVYNEQRCENNTYAWI